MLSVELLPTFEALALLPVAGWKTIIQKIGCLFGRAYVHWEDGKTTTHSYITEPLTAEYPQIVVASAATSFFDFTGPSGSVIGRRRNRDPSVEPLGLVFSRNAL